MSNTDTIIRSVPMGDDGLPLDKSLIRRSPNEGANVLPEVPASAHVPILNELHDRPFDPQQFKASLPKMETAPIASMAEATGRSGGVRVVQKKKPEVRYLGARPEPVTIPLDEPFEYDGVNYSEIRLSSPMGSRFSQYVAYLQDYTGEDVIIWLVSDLPIEAVEGISFSDRMHINGEAFPFLPRRMRESLTKAGAEMEANSSTMPDQTEA